MSNPARRLVLLGEPGVLALEADVLTIETGNEPGVLTEIAERLAEGRGEHLLHLSAGDRGAERGLIILGPFGCRKARRMLEQR